MIDVRYPDSYQILLRSEMSRCVFPRRRRSVYHQVQSVGERTRDAVAIDFSSGHSGCGLDLSGGPSTIGRSSAEAAYSSTAPNVYSLLMHRLATCADASRLFELRRKSIVVLAPGGMSQAEAETWAAKLTVAGMQQKLSQLEIWVAEVDASITGWAAIHGDRLEGIYVDPVFAGKGFGTGLLELVEGRMRAKGVASISAEASANAERFYLQRGYQPVGIRTQEYGLPIRKRLE